MSKAAGQRPYPLAAKPHRPDFWRRLHQESLRRRESPDKSPGATRHPRLSRCFRLEIRAPGGAVGPMRPGPIGRAQATIT